MGLRSRNEKSRRWSSRRQKQRLVPGPNSEAEITAGRARARQRLGEARKRVDCSAAADCAKVTIGSATGTAPVPFYRAVVATLACEIQLFGSSGWNHVGS
jgi:hypothetical protein